MKDFERIQYESVTEGRFSNSALCLASALTQKEDGRNPTIFRNE